MEQDMWNATFKPAERRLLPLLPPARWHLMPRSHEKKNAHIWKCYELGLFEGY